MVNVEYINGLISHPEQMNSVSLYQLRTLVARYPYFQKARLLLLYNLYLLRDPDFNTELHRSIFYIADRSELWLLVNGLAATPANTSSTTSANMPADKTAEVSADKPNAEKPDRTMSLIDDFLRTMPGQPEKLVIDNPAATDYLSAIGWASSDDLPIVPLKSSEDFEKSDDSDDSELSEIPDILRSSEGTEVSENEVLQPEFLTETLAHIYIKQKKYDRALAIIRSLYLNYPEKSIYFADQIRFLEKLVRNNQSKKV